MTQRTIYLRRRDRRALAKKAGLPLSASVNTPENQVRVIRHLMYWRGLVEERVTAHVFSHCRRLFNEWAGRDLTLARRNNPLPGMRICPECRRDVAAGRTA